MDDSTVEQRYECMIDYLFWYASGCFFPEKAQKALEVRDDIRKTLEALRRIN